MSIERRGFGIGWLLSSVVALGCGARSALSDREAPSETGGSSSAGAGTSRSGQSHGGAGRAGAQPAGGHGGALVAGGASSAGVGGESQTGGEGGAYEPPASIVIWGKGFGDAQADQTAAGIAVQPSGVFAITGSITGTADFGLGRTPRFDEPAGYLARFDGGGAPLWSRQLAGAGDVSARGVAIAENERLHWVGRFSGSAELAATQLEAVDGRDAFLASFESDGALRFARAVGAASAQEFNAVAALSEGSIACAGAFAPSLPAKVNAEITLFDEAGEERWALSGGDRQPQSTLGIARSLDDHLFVAGQMSGSLRLGACSAVGSNGGFDGWLAWLDPAGNCIASQGFGDEKEQRALAVAKSDGLGSLVAVAGVFEGRLELGNDVTARDADAFVALFERDISSFTLRPVWVRRIGGEGTDQARGVAFDRADNVIVVGEYEGSDPDVGLRRSAGQDAFVVKYDSAGNVAWASAFGAAGRQVASGVGTDGTSHIYVAGSFEETVPLSTGTLRSNGADDIFVIKLAP